MIKSKKHVSICNYTTAVGKADKTVSSWCKNGNEGDERDVGEERDARHDSTAEAPRFRIMLDLRIIQRDSLLRITPSNLPCPRSPHERCCPPQRKQHKAQKEKPSLNRTPRFILVAKSQRPPRILYSRRLSRILHMKLAGSRDGRCVW